jgi:hypothetical protein
MAQPAPKSKHTGRPKGARNKTTIERERKELEALKERARRAEFSPLAKDELAALIPEAKELLGVVKGIVGRFQREALVEGATAAAWDTLKGWMELYAEVMLKASQIEYRAADFQSPKFRAIVVAPPPTATDKEGRLTKFSLKVFEGGRGLMPPQANGGNPPALIPAPLTGTDDGEV